MKKQTRFNVAVITAGLLLAAGTVLAADQSSAGSNPNMNNMNMNNSANSSANQESDQMVRASKLIGKSVKNDQNQTVCDIKDLVVDLNSGTARFAIVSVGGVAGLGGKRIAVPLSSIQYAQDGTLTTSATRQDLENAAATPSGSWAFASGQEWARGIEGYYGEPGAINGQFERESAQPGNAGREPVRSDTEEQTPKGAEQDQQGSQNNPASDMSGQQSPPSTDALQDNVNQTIRQSYGQDIANGIHVSVNNGVVTLTGTVSSQSTKDSLDSKLQSLSGVQSVDDQLTVQNQ